MRGCRVEGLLHSIIISSQVFTDIPLSYHTIRKLRLGLSDFKALRGRLHFLTWSAGAQDHQLRNKKSQR